MNPSTKSQAMGPARLSARQLHRIAPGPRRHLHAAKRLSRAIGWKPSAKVVLSALSSARDLGMPFTELAADFAGLEIRARDLAGGAIIFVTPQEY